jgi:type IV pilus assembly protein PilX
MRPAAIAVRSLRSRQHGAVLFVSLILLVILTLIGVVAARMQTVEAGMARNDHNHQLAMQSAEAALRNAEINVMSGIYSPPQFAQDSNGLYTLQLEVQGAVTDANGNGTSVADVIDWDNAGAAQVIFSTAPPSPTYNGPPLQPAKVIIESLPPVARAGDPLCSASYGAQEACAVYRITAHATGGDSTASATLQSVIH